METDQHNTYYLNGFTVISFNYNNRYISLTSKNFTFNKPTINVSNDEKKILKTNLNNSSNNDISALNHREFWIIENELGNYEIQINNSSILPNKNIVGPFYNEEDANLTLEQLNNGDTY